MTLAKARGLTLIELLFAVAITASLIAGLATIVNQSLQSRRYVEQQLALALDAQFAMERIAQKVRRTERLMLPFPDNPATAWREHVREQSIPAQAPESGSSFASAVLAITLDPFHDGDGDGWADSNTDKDYYDFNSNSARDADEPERVDEDWKHDVSNDNKAGIIGIDDNGDGGIDNSFGGKWDDDEDGAWDEDPIDGIDNDGDGNIDEDPSSDMNGDGEGGIPGESCLLFICTPNSDPEDDDADGDWDEDGPNPIVYYLSGNQLIERLPEFSGANPSGSQFTESTIANNVSYFSVERIPNASGTQLLHITLELQSGTSTIRLSNQLRVGSPP